MAEVTLHTLQLTSAGGITCRHCNHQTLISEGEDFLLWDTGSRLKVEYATGGLLHRCGRELELVCLDCGDLAEIVIPPRGGLYRGLLPRCLTCGLGATQRVRKSTK